MYGKIEKPITDTSQKGVLTVITILTVSDDKERRKLLVSAMREYGYETAEATDARSALECLEHTAVQLVLADYDAGACELTAELRAGESRLPVLVLVPTGRMGEKRRVFRSGADGYMLLPPEKEELQMRVESLLWRCNVVSDSLLRVGSCELHAGTMQLLTPDMTIDLRRLEFLLLQKLLSYPGKIFTRPQLMDELWGYDSDSDPRTVDTHVKLLRKKLRAVDDIRIQTVRGLGYRAVIRKN